MAINVKATRKVSLKGFAIGWDDCFLIVNTVSGSASKELNQRIDELQETKDVNALNVLLSNFCTENILKGKIMNTDDNGSAVLYEFSMEETADVVDVLNTAWQLEVISIATGTDRLK